MKGKGREKERKMKGKGKGRSICRLRLSLEQMGAAKVSLGGSFCHLLHLCWFLQE